MNTKTIVGLLALSTQFSSAATWLPESILARRDDGTSGGVFDGTAPSSQVASEGSTDLLDGQSVILTSGLDVDTEASGLAAGINLDGDNYDWSTSFRIYDRDGIFTFTENFDDSVRFNATPIVSNVDGTARGAAGTTYQDLVWNVRTFANYDFSTDAGGPGGGWFDIAIELDEVGGGAQSAGGIGIGYFNDNSQELSNFGGIGYSHGDVGFATFDRDVAGNSFGAAVDVVPEPTGVLLSFLGLGMLGFRRRR